MLFQDLRYAIRHLIANKGFAAVAMLTLAVGIGVNTAIFSVVNTVLLRPFIFHEPDRIYQVFETHPAPVGRTRASAENFLDWQKQTRSFEALAGHIGNGFTLTGRGEPEFVIGQMTSAELFTVLGVPPLHGRVLRAEENEAGRDQVMVISYGLWQRRFGGDPNVIGHSVTANGKQYTIVGVMPREFVYPRKEHELWVPFAFRNNPDGMVNRTARFLQVVGRLRDRVTAAQAQAEMETLARQLEQQFPNENDRTGATISPLVEEIVGPTRSALLLLLAAVGFVLLIACTNVTNLLLARGTARQKEIAIRTALGAGRARIARQLLTETLFLYVAGALAGLTLAAWSLDLIVQLSPVDLPRLDQLSIDWRVLAFTGGASLLTGLVFGLIPALQTTKADGGEELKMSARALTAHRDRQWVRMTLVGAEVALSVVLLVGAGLTTRSLMRLNQVGTGFDPNGVLTFGLPLPATEFQTADRLRTFYGTLLGRLNQRPGVMAAGATTHLPLSGQNMENGFTAEGWVPANPADRAMAGMRGITPGYLAAMGIAVRRGRTFSDQDHERSLPVVMVNETFAARFWPGQDPIGRRLKEGAEDSEEPWRTVIGTYADVKHSGPQAETRPEVLFPYVQLDDAFTTRWARSMNIVVRTSGDPLALLPAARGEVRALNPSAPLIAPQPMTALVTEAVAQPRFRTALLMLFAVVAALLAAIGIYGVLAVLVAQRTSEIGIRLALGASHREVLKLIVLQGAVPVGLGLASGVAASLLLTRAMQSLLFQVAPTDPLTFATVIVGLGLVALGATLVPARRALRVNPITALRAE